MTKVFLLVGLLTLCQFAQANNWVYGKVKVLDEYAGYGDGNFQVLVTLSEKEWINTPTGNSICTERFSLQTGAQGLTEEAKNRIFSMLLAAHMSDQKVGLFVNLNGPYCKIQIGRIGDV